MTTFKTETKTLHLGSKDFKAKFSYSYELEEPDYRDFEKDVAESLEQSVSSGELVCVSVVVSAEFEGILEEDALSQVFVRTGKNEMIEDIMETIKEHGMLLEVSCNLKKRMLDLSQKLKQLGA